MLPRVRARGQSDGEARLLVVGAGTEDIAALRGLPGVEVVGHASDEEVAQLLGRTKVCHHATIFSYFYTTVRKSQGALILLYSYSYTAIYI